ncbi:MAG: hypothetical protein WBG41_02690 [Acidimicrobiales bacterium]
MRQRLIVAGLAVAAGSFVITGFAPSAHAGARAQAGHGDGQALVKTTRTRSCPSMAAPSTA